MFKTNAFPSFYSLLLSLFLSACLQIAAFTLAPISLTLRSVLSVFLLPFPLKLNLLLALV